MPDNRGRFRGAIQPESSPVSAWKGQVRSAFAFGFVMLLIGALGLVAALYGLQPNTVSLTARNTDNEPVTFDLRLTGIALLSGTFILICLTEAVLSFARSRSIQDRVSRWEALTYLLDELTPEELLRLIEHGPREEVSPAPHRQMRLAWPSRSLKEEERKGTAQ